MGMSIVLFKTDFSHFWLTVEYLFTVKEKEINNFPIINFIKLFVKLDGKNFEPIKTKRFEISEVYSTSPTVKSQYEQK